MRPFVTPPFTTARHGFSTGLLNTSLPIVIRGTSILTYKTTLLSNHQIQLYDWLFSNFLRVVTSLSGYGRLITSSLDFLPFGNSRLRLALARLILSSAPIFAVQLWLFLQSISQLKNNKRMGSLLTVISPSLLRYFLSQAQLYHQ